MLDTLRARVDRDHHFTPHVHDAHELLWGTTGFFTVTSADSTWITSPTIGVLIPAGVLHGGFGAGSSSFYQSHLPLDRFDMDWTRPTVVGIPPVLRELLLHLSRERLTDASRSRIERIAFEMVVPLQQATFELSMPRDERARRVAEAVIADPTDRRTLAQWGREVGASERTLTRLFADQTQQSFARWRVQASIGAAIPLLAAGESVSTVAGRVGYLSASAFVRAFRGLTGQTPGAAHLPQRSVSGLEFTHSVR